MSIEIRFNSIDQLTTLDQNILPQTSELKQRTRNN